MWLPSDIFPADDVTAFPLEASMFSYYSSGRHNILHRPYNTQFYRPAVQHRSQLQGGAASAYGGSRMFLTPVQLQVEMLRREERMLRILPGQNFGIPRGVLEYEEQKKLNQGPRGEYRGKGTGVFIPRTLSVTNNGGIAARTSGTREESKLTTEGRMKYHVTRTREETLSSSFRNFSVGVDEKEMNGHFPPLTGARTKQENQVHSHINSLKRFDTRKEAECHYQLQPELALPPEWTY